MLRLSVLACLLALWTDHVQGYGCSIQGQPANNYKLTVASGYTWGVAAKGLTTPRSLEFDDAGNLWVLESGKGVSKWSVQDKGGSCVIATNGTTILSDTSLNHGMVVDSDKKRLIVSSSDIAYQVSLDSAMTTVNPASKSILVTNMSNSDHVTRTLLLVKGKKDVLVVSRGAASNMDALATDIHSGHAVVKAFDMSSRGAADFTSHGALLGWGLRNDVGMARHPRTHELWTVENSADDIQRDGVDVHNTNPGEELNLLGVVNPAQLAAHKAKNYGYPVCFSAWQPSVLPNNTGLKVGSPFALSSADDYQCKATQPARLTFEAHTAPLDIIFNKGADKAWISFHGSWDASPPVGYHVGYVDFNKQGKPTAPADSTQALNVVLANQDLTVCPGSCLRPSGLAFDKLGRLWITSTDSGELYVLAKA